MSPSSTVHGEHLGVPERVILAPAVGVFHPLSEAAGDAAAGNGGEEEAASGGERAEGSLVTAGQVVGLIEASGRSLPVRSSFTGRLMGMLAHPGERVREGQPVAWLRVVV